MKTFNLILLIFAFNSLCFSQTLEANKNEALLNILIVDKNDKPIEERIVIQSVKTMKEFIVVSNKNGLAKLLIPKSETYFINLEFEPKYDTLQIPDMEYYTLSYKIFYDKDRFKNSTFSTLHFQVSTKDGKPLSEEVKFTSIKTKTEYLLTTDINGKSIISIPNNDSYYVSFKSAPNYGFVEIPNVPNYEMNFRLTYGGSYNGVKYPSLTEALFLFKFIDLDSVPVQNEAFYLKSVNTGKIYKAQTKAQGVSTLLVPIGDTYNISSEYYKNFGMEKIGSKQGLYQVDVTLKFISSIEFVRRKEEQEKRSIERENEWERRKKQYDEFIKSGLASLKSGTAISLFNYAPMTDTAFSAVMNRNKQWKNKLIVLDVTGSMRPYDDQVKMWYELNYAQDDPIQFVLFNDGDNMPDNLKEIGKTGGIHYCLRCDIKTFEDTLDYARFIGDGGDLPENDLEATIAAVKTCKNYTDIILVADNYAPVKDIELLNQIDKPIKIILCGANNGLVNVDYLDIAYHTKGSIHTIEEDIVNIGNTIEGAKIRIGKNLYVLTKGKFLHYRDDRR